MCSFDIFDDKDICGTSTKLQRLIIRLTIILTCLSQLMQGTTSCRSCNSEATQISLQRSSSAAMIQRMTMSVTV